MPRKSLASLAVPVPIRAEPARIVAPPDLTAAERTVWQATVRALPAEWFKPEQAPVLAQFCRLTVQSDLLARSLNASDPATDLDRYAKLLRLAGEVSGRILALARAMRLTQQSRIHVVTAANRAAAAQPQRTPEDDARAVAELVALRRARQ